MTVVKLSFSEKVFLSYGVIAKNYKCIGGYMMYYSISPFFVYANDSQLLQTSFYVFVQIKQQKWSSTIKTTFQATIFSILLL